MFSNLPMLVMKRGEPVRWYVMTLGVLGQYPYAPLARKRCFVCPRRFRTPA
jgi:hypothetical protein